MNHIIRDHNNIKSKQDLQILYKYNKVELQLLPTSNSTWKINNIALPNQVGRLIPIHQILISKMTLPVEIWKLLELVRFIDLFPKIKNLKKFGIF